MDESLAELLHRVTALLGERARERMHEPDGLSYAQLRLLGTLDDKAPLTQHQLAGAMVMSDPAVSRALRPLQTRGLVQIDVDPAHARRRIVTLTAAGRRAFHAEGKPLEDEFADALQANGFPYQRYLADTVRLAELLDTRA